MQQSAWLWFRQQRRPADEDVREVILLALLAEILGLGEEDYVIERPLSDRPFEQHVPGAAARSRLIKAATDVHMALARSPDFRFLLKRWVRDELDTFVNAVEASNFVLRAGITSRQKDMFNLSMHMLDTSQKSRWKSKRYSKTSLAEALEHIEDFLNMPLESNRRRHSSSE